MAEGRPLLIYRNVQTLARLSDFTDVRSPAVSRTALPVLHVVGFSHAHTEEAAAYLISFCCSEAFENVCNINLRWHQQILLGSTGGVDGNVTVRLSAEASLVFLLVFTVYVYRW